MGLETAGEVMTQLFERNMHIRTLAVRLPAG